MVQSATQRAQDVSAELRRVFDLQRAHQWEAKASTAAERKEKLGRLKAAVEAHAEELVAAVRKDTRKPEHEVRITGPSGLPMPLVRVRRRAT